MSSINDRSSPMGDGLEVTRDFIKEHRSKPKSKKETGDLIFEASREKRAVAIQKKRDKVEEQFHAKKRHSQVDRPQESSKKQRLVQTAAAPQKKNQIESAMKPPTGEKNLISDAFQERRLRESVRKGLGKFHEEAKNKLKAMARDAKDALHPNASWASADYSENDRNIDKMLESTLKILQEKKDDPEVWNDIAAQFKQTLQKEVQRILSQGSKK
jgi:hypothetical protein